MRVFPNFVTFEGGEGSGKSSVISSVSSFLRSEFPGLEVVVSREPGGSVVGEKLREVLMSFKLSPYSELLLFLAQRFEHVSHIKNCNGLVLCDRYHDSTLAYQVFGRGLDAGLIAPFYELIDCVPGRTYLLDVPVSVGLSRVKKRGELSVFDSEVLDFHERVRAGFLSLARDEPSRFFVVDAEKPLDYVVSSVLDDLVPYLRSNNLV